jgi:hypothetical protein
MCSILLRVPAAAGSPTDGKLSPTSATATPTSRPPAAATANDVLANPSRYVAINYIAKLSVVDLGIAFTNTRINFSLFYWCCCYYITVDSAKAASQNGFCSYKLSIHKKTNIMQIMIKILHFLLIYRKIS